MPLDPRSAAGGILLALLVGFMLWGPRLLPTPREDAGLPKELEPRSKAFALALEQEVQFKVVTLPNATDETAKVQVQIDGLKSPTGSPPELPLFWRQDGANWMFQPPPASS